MISSLYQFDCKLFSLSTFDSSLNTWFKNKLKRERALVAANSREREKVNTYRKTAERMGARIIPLVFEATGAFGTDTLKTVANFSKLYKQKNGEEFGPCSSAVFPATDPAIYWKHILAVSFAKGTYDMSVYIDRAGHQSSAASGPRRR